MLSFHSAFEQYQQAKASIEALKGVGENEVGRLVDRYHAALDKVMKTPAPNVAALVQKIQAAMDASPTPEGGGDIEAPRAAIILRDARRLAA